MAQTKAIRKKIKKAKEAVILNRYCDDEKAFKKLVNNLIKVASAVCEHKRTEACGMDCICKDCGDYI
jgi:hypothetical protein